MTDKSRLLAVVGLCVFGISPLAAGAADEADEAEARRCVQLVRIARTDIVDDYNILFHMRNKDVYVNRLPHRCMGLRNERTFMYRTSMSQLCDLDIITVIYDHGFGFTPGASCGLGRFYPITAEEAKALKEAGSKRIKKEDVEPAELEELEK